MTTTREQAREAVMKAFLPSIPKQIEAKIAADAASDVWEPLLREIHTALSDVVHMVQITYPEYVYKALRRGEKALE